MDAFKQAFRENPIGLVGGSWLAVVSGTLFMVHRKQIPLQLKIIQGIAAIIAATSAPEPKTDPRARFSAGLQAPAAPAAAVATVIAADKALA